MCVSGRIQRLRVDLNQYFVQMSHAAITYITILIVC